MIKYDEKCIKISYKGVNIERNVNKYKGEA